ncbi:NAD(P)-binding protein [Massarina eburnea CBS 473.64]|uniref:NAD(P)-binding protein n=1 Tax=Massarina eburnea CBS 473.64 TaxID=1395130 RepID=A0A6A6RT70_9PLEO|nr:NAD(P)-binding protein [Massarina eburnea CBS 473.64]
MASLLPPSYGHAFTPTTHSQIPPNISPTQSRLPRPFVAVVTGAGKGLGYHISLAYARAGCTGLSISSRTVSDLANLEAAIKKIDAGIVVQKTICDTQSSDSVAELEKNVRETFGRVDVVIANAGIISRYIDDARGAGESDSKSKSKSKSNLPVGLIEDDDWARVLDVNLLGTWRISKAFLPLLIETKDGPQTLICSTSLAAHSTDSSFVPIAYNVSKLACNRLIEHIANDHGKDGIHAYALHPGAVVTPQTQGHEGAVWGDLLSDDEGLAGAMCVWLSKEKRGWLSGRYVSCNWDVDELEGKKDEIVNSDKLKFRMEI